MFILFFIMFLFGSNLYAQSFSAAKSNSINFLDDNFDFEFMDEVTENSLLKVPVPKELVEYTIKLSDELFAQTEYSREGNGQIYWVSPFLEGVKDPETYKDFSIQMYRQTYSSNPGIAISIYNEKEKQRLAIVNPQDNEYMRGWKLCKLPTSADSSELLQVIKYTDLKSKDQFFDPDKLISKGYIGSLAMGFAEADGDWFFAFDGTAYNAQFVVSKSGPVAIFKYEDDGSSNNIKIPIYVYGDTVCFLGITDDKNAVRDQGTSYNTGSRYIGTGYLQWNLVKTLYKESLSKVTLPKK